MQEFVEEWLERNNLSKLKSLFEGVVQNFQRMWVDEHSNVFFFLQKKQRNISSALFNKKTT